MSLISLHRKYSFVDYQNSLCSFAALVTFLIILTSLVLPFIWIYNINGSNFSLADDVIVFDQPMVKFQFKYIFVAEHSMDSEQKAILCSSFDALNQQEGVGNCAKLKVMERDDNFDGIPDEILFTLDFHTMFRYGIKALSLVAFLDARIDHHCQFRIPSAIIISKRSFHVSTDFKILISGSLQPIQDQALRCPFFLRNIKSHFFYDNLNENQTNLEEFHLRKIRENLERNPLHFHFQETSTDLQGPQDDKTSIEIKLKIPQIPIRYKKTFWQDVNDVWINYIAVFVVTFSIGNFLLNHLFENRLLIARREIYNKNKEI